VFVDGRMNLIVLKDIHLEEENRGSRGPQQRNILPADPPGNGCGKTAQAGGCT
jgi:hypothetical protein